MVLEKCKFSALNDAASGIRWGHLTQGFDNPMDNEFVHIVMEGERRVIGKPPSQQKAQMNMDMAKTVVETFGIQVKHFTFTNDHLEIIIPKSKMDRQR